MLSISFFGTPHESVIVLDELFNRGFTIACVITKPPQPLGRKKILTETPVAIWAKKHSFPLITPASHKKKPWLYAKPDQLTQEVLAYHPDILITADYTQKVPQTLIEQTKFGGLNVHPSLLPAYRGPAPVPWAILRGETESGVSIVTLTERFDAGKIIAQVTEPIHATDTTPILLNRLFTKGAKLLTNILPNYPNLPYPNILKPKTYHLKPSYYPRLSREDGYIPWNILNSALENLPLKKEWLSHWSVAKYFNEHYLIHNSKFTIHNSFRALTPWPGIWTKVTISGQNKRLKILNLQLTDYNPSVSLRASLQLKSIQLEGRQPISGKDAQNFLNSLKL